MEARGAEPNLLRKVIEELKKRVTPERFHNRLFLKNGEDVVLVDD